MSFTAFWLIGAFICFVGITNKQGAFVIILEIIASLAAWPFVIGLILRPQITKILKEI